MAVPSTTGCIDAPLFTAADIYGSYENCEICAEPCWQVVDCENPEYIICTSEQAGADPAFWNLYTNRILRFEDPVDSSITRCGYVTKGRCIDLDCDFVFIQDLDCFSTCEECYPQPVPVVTNFTQRSVYPGYDTPACRPDVYDKTKCNWSEILYQEMASKRYGIDFCCTVDSNKWIIKNELIDFAAVTDSSYSNPISCNCYFYTFYNYNDVESGVISSISTVNCNGDSISKTLNPPSAFVLCQTEEQHAAGSYIDVSEIVKGELCCNNAAEPNCCKKVIVTGVGKDIAFGYTNCETGEYVAVGIGLGNIVILNNFDMCAPYEAVGVTIEFPLEIIDP